MWIQHNKSIHLIAESRILHARLRELATLNKNAKSGKIVQREIGKSYLFYKPKMHNNSVYDRIQERKMHNFRSILCKKTKGEENNDTKCTGITINTSNEYE